VAQVIALRAPSAAPDAAQHGLSCEQHEERLPRRERTMKSHSCRRLTSRLGL
jgi:hypothetical protein